MSWNKKTIWGLKASEVRALLAIRQEGGKGRQATVSEISRVLKVTSPTVTQMINNLIKQGYVVRDKHPNDQRISILTLTRPGEECADEANRTYTALFRGLMDHLGDEESDRLIELLEQVFDYLEKHDLE
nr:MarR family transcriptional regulator [Saccharibacillus sp. WB 17]